MAHEPRWKDATTDQLCRAFLTLKTEEEVSRLLEDLCTINEIKAMAQRLEVAKHLAEGITYETVSERTGASSATISRVNRYLLYGADGYKIVLERLGK